MRKNLPLELSFIQEGKNSEKIAQLLGHHKWLVIPKISWKHSTERVLVMEYCKGKLLMSWVVGLPKFWGIFASNSIIEFDPNRDSIPIFGSLQHRFTTFGELQSRPFYLNISPKMAYFEALQTW